MLKADCAIPRRRKYLLQRRYYFDTVNYGYVYTYDAGGINTGATDGEVGDDNTQSGTPDLGALGKWLEDLKGSVINTKYDYYSLSYNPDGTKDGRIPIQTYIGGNVYCQGRMIIAPDSNTSYVNYKKLRNWVYRRISRTLTSISAAKL